jgi:TetR/AcrR family transcriptional repressor of nem operon
MTEELRPFFEYLSSIIKGSSRSLRRQKALATYASLVGALVVSRVVDDPNLSNEVLAAVAATMHNKEPEPSAVKSSAKRRRSPLSKIRSVKRPSRKA